MGLMKDSNALHFYYSIIFLHDVCKRKNPSLVLRLFNHNHHHLLMPLYRTERFQSPSDDFLFPSNGRNSHARYNGKRRSARARPRKFSIPMLVVYGWRKTASHAFVSSLATTTCFWRLERRSWSARRQDFFFVHATTRRGHTRSNQGPSSTLRPANS